MGEVKEKILVIGDWFIDENWLMAKTDNYHSTDVGEVHYSSLIKGPADFVLKAYFSRRLSDPKGPLEGPRTMCTWPTEIGS